MGRWIEPQQLGQLTDSPEAIAWLTERGSMTERLRRHYPGLSVRVWSEGLAPLLPCEAQKLGLAPNSLAWLREVTLHQDGLDLVHARTAIPGWSEHNPWCEVQRLGDRPLGEILFSDTELERSGFDFALDASWRRPGMPPAGERLARRCVYHRQGAPLLLTEWFLLLEP